MKLNSKGAASILVILIVVVLATFGGIALTAGWTNKQLSIKAAQSKADFYMLDSVAEEMLAQTDSTLYSASEETVEILNSVSQINEEVFSINPRFTPLYNVSPETIKSEALRTKIISEVFIRTYYYEASKKLEELAKEKDISVYYSDYYQKPEDFLDVEHKIPVAGDLKIVFTVSEGENPGNKNLDIEIAVLAPEIKIRINSDEMWRTDFTINQEFEGLRYSIHSWKLRQNPIEYEGENPKFG